MKETMLFDWPVKADDQGYICLTDIWNATGQRKYHKPGTFLKKPRTKEYLEILRQSESPVFYETEDGNLFACTKLAYDYACWLSPEFTVFKYQVYEAHLRGA